MKPEELANILAGKKCPQCKIPECELWRITETSLIGSKCNLSMSVLNHPVCMEGVLQVSVQDSKGNMREFRAPETTAPEELFRNLVQALVLLEECSIGWNGSTIIQSITELLRHGMEKLGVTERYLEIRTAKSTSKIGLLNGKENWMDGSIFGGGD
jgi:hypothetical protein